MPLNLPTFRKLTPEDFGTTQYDIIGALGRGQNLLGQQQQYEQAKQLFPGQLESQKAALAAQLIKNKYLPLTTQAEAASKLAYANLVAPQYIAKLLSNPDVIANLPESQRQELIKFVSSAPQRAATLPSLNVPGYSGIQPQQAQPSFTTHGGRTYSTTPENYENIQKLQPGESYTIPSESKMKGYQEPQEITEGNYFERAGKAAGLKEQEKELGKIRATDIQEFGNQYESSLDRGYAFDQLNKTITNPIFENMRNRIPFFQSKQLKVLSKIGTPEEKQLIGNFITSSQEIVKDTVNSFKGQRLKGELDVAQNMKVSDDDTFDVARGKLESAQLYNEMGKQRAKISSELMADKKLNKQKSLEIADKMINGDSIRDEIRKKLNLPTEKDRIKIALQEPTDADFRHTAQINGVSVEEVKNRWKEAHGKK